DVIVVDDRGKPIQNLAPADFTVRVDGNARRVVSAEWLSLVKEEKAKPAASLPEGYTSNENATGGRLIMIAIDEPNIRFGAAMAVGSGDRSTGGLVVARECRTERTPQAYEACRQQVESEAMQIAQEAQHSADLTMRGLRNVLLGLRGIDAPKTLILMSEGFVMEGTSAEVADLGTMAAAARTSMYALQLDENAYDVTQARVPLQPMADRRARSEGL